MQAVYNMQAVLEVQLTISKPLPFHWPVMSSNPDGEKGSKSMESKDQSEMITCCYTGFAESPPSISLFSIQKIAYFFYGQKLLVFY